MKSYVGIREGSLIRVTVDGRPLNPRLDLWNHSPTGFEWGYGGSGPAQLALALLADHLGNDDVAVSLHQEFKFRVIAKLPHRGWIVTSAQIETALISLKAPSLPQTALLLNDRPASAGALRVRAARRIPVAVLRLGRIVATPNALASIAQNDVLVAIQRHQAGDWGSLTEKDRAANDRALAEGTRILSAYTAANGTKFWIITEADRSATTVLLPEDY